MRQGEFDNAAVAFAGQSREWTAAGISEEGREAVDELFTELTRLRAEIAAEDGDGTPRKELLR